MARSFLRGEHLRCRGVFLCCVSDGCLSSGRPFFIRNVSPTAYVPSSFFFFMPPAGNFLSIAKESTQRTPLETDGFKTSFVECKSYFLNPAETGNWSASTHAAATLGGCRGLPLYRLKIHLPNRTVIPRKPPKCRLWRIQRGGFKKVSRFSGHNVVGNRLTRRCRQSADWLWESVFPGGKRNIFFA